jgi:uncharacterized protein (DUF1919 family)
MFLGDIEIHWIHENNEKLLMQKYRERLKASLELEPVFLWSDPEMFNIHPEKERCDLLKRFCNVPYKTLFLTKYRDEAYEGNTSRIVFIPEWRGKSQLDRYQQNFMIIWYTHPRLSELFKLNMYEDNNHIKIKQ